MLAKYSLVTDEITVEGQRVTVHGIECQNLLDHNTIRIRDISTNSSALYHWTSLMNRLELLPIHFRDVVEDILLTDF